jgi:transcriptional regulator with XRE-family HTH domain
MREVAEDALLKAIAAELVARRNASGLAQDELAYEAGVARSFLARVETCKSQLSIASLFKLSAALGVPADELTAGIARRYRRELRSPKA